MTIWQKIKIFFNPPKPKRLELRFVTWIEAENLLKHGWTLAKEEDTNHILGWVFLEWLERPSADPRCMP